MEQTENIRQLFKALLKDKQLDDVKINEYRETFNLAVLNISCGEDLFEPIGKIDIKEESSFGQYGKQSVIRENSSIPSRAVPKLRNAKIWVSDLISSSLRSLWTAPQLISS